MAARRSTQLLVLGLGAFVVGTGLVLFTLGAGDGDTTAGATTGSRARAGASATTKGAAGPDAPEKPVLRDLEGRITLPDGKRAVAVSLPSVAGTAGHAKPGDLVDVYATVEPEGNPPPPPYAKLLLQSVQVLDVVGDEDAANGQATFLLALDPVSAEKLVYLARFESAWLTLVPPGTPAAQTPGHDQQSLLS